MKKEENGFGSKSCFTQLVTAGFFCLLARATASPYSYFGSGSLMQAQVGPPLILKSSLRLVIFMI